MQIPAGDEWKVTLAKEILDVKNGHLSDRKLQRSRHQNNIMGYPDIYF